jgi:hypothetical protein
MDDRDVLLATLHAKQSITEVLHRYCYAMDRIDNELGYQVWHPDGTADYEGVFHGTGRGFVDWVLGQHRTFGGTSHQVTNIQIDVVGDDATSEAYVTACNRMGDQDWVIRARYIDTWSCRAGEWRIDARRCVQDLIHVAQVVQLPSSS